jgi:hypothetical protein
MLGKSSTFKHLICINGLANKKHQKKLRWPTVERLVTSVKSGTPFK